ncbi:GNAT family N-acetyltransferase [Lactiplantibacillus sp. WILCCON 0030]|uniref:GNAT family N-acetyltransferase n=1 Tax=Lactiplantibacillus brownii TaxID=3069269 RepID=A0ABU1ABW5_9LACO|nr:GNAT family N-acetyltransferase [Lactiplantibacillus brownii]MDQ7937912.1 GNAT family N-acetyltransferase [Lactiplantibacillus brownii]
MKIKKSNQTTSPIYDDAIMIRRAVFIAEQKIDPALELDTVTTATWHYVLYDDAGAAVATARMTPESAQQLHIQRVATLKAARGQGYAQALIKQLLQDGQQQGYQEAVLGAQVTAQGFYQQLGFKPFGERFMEAGLLHQNMHRKLTN